MFKLFLLQLLLVISLFSVALTADADTVVATGDVVQRVVTSSRTLGTVYHNTTGTGLPISVTCSGSGSMLIYSDSANPPTTIVQSMDCSPTAVLGISAVIPDNYYYKVTAPVLNVWSEWYFSTTSIISVATSTISTSTQYIINNNQDIFNGFIMFFMTAFGIMWIFRRLK